MSKDMGVARSVSSRHGDSHADVPGEQAGLERRHVVAESKRLRSLRIHIHEFGRALRYFVMAYIAWEFLRFLAGRPVQVAEWRRSGKLAVVLRALPTYFLCGAAFGNLSGFIHRLSPTDHDQWLIAADRIVGFGHD